MPFDRESSSNEISAWKRVVDNLLGGRPEPERVQGAELDLAAIVELENRQRRRAENLARRADTAQEPLRVTGKISRGTTERLLRGLAHGRYTGTFQASSAHKTVRLRVARKQLHIVDTGDPELRLGALALREKLIEREQLFEALKFQSLQEGHPSLGRVLLGRSLMAEPALRWLLHKQARQVIDELRLWQEGFFLFEEHPVDLAAGCALVDPMLRLERLVYEAGRVRGF